MNWKTWIVLFTAIIVFMIGVYSSEIKVALASEKGSSTDKLIKQLEKMNKHMENLDANVAIIKNLIATDRGIEEKALNEFDDSMVE